jgi:hypothetical protein
MKYIYLFVVFDGSLFTHSKLFCLSSDRKDRYRRNVPNQFVIAPVHIFSQFNYRSMDWNITSSNSGTRNEFISSSERPDRVWGPTQPLIQCASGVFPEGYSGWILKFTTHLHLMPGVRMSGAILLVPLHAFVALTGT